MIKQLLQGVQSAIALLVLDRYRCLSVELIKIEAARSYVRGVQVARSATGGLLLIRLIMALIFFGVVLAHVGLFVLLPWTLENKAILGLALGLSYVAVGGLILRFALKEQTWMNASGATRLVSDAVKP